MRASSQRRVRGWEEEDGAGRRWVGGRWTAESWDDDDRAHRPRCRRHSTGGGLCAVCAPSLRGEKRREEGGGRRDGAAGWECWGGESRGGEGEAAGSLPVEPERKGGEAQAAGEESWGGGESTGGGGERVRQRAGRARRWREQRRRCDKGLT